MTAGARAFIAFVVAAAVALCPIVVAVVAAVRAEYPELNRHPEH